MPAYRCDEMHRISDASLADVRPDVAGGSSSTELAEATRPFMSAMPPIATAQRVNNEPPLSANSGRTKPVYSITSSALAKNVSGICTPIALDVFKLTANSNLVGCSTGIFSGLVPRRILSVISAERAKSEGKLGP
jgi:hypothetical protein